MSRLLELWTGFCLALGDPLLGWMLAMPTDLLLITLAVLTSVLMTLIRKWTSDQPLLARVEADKQRHKQLVRAAKAAGDREALERLKLLGNRHALKAIAQEGRPLLWSVLPIAILATWAFERVEVVPPKPGSPVVVSVVSRPTASGLVHLVPGDGITADGLVRRLDPAEAWGQACSKATWRVIAAAGDHTLTFRNGDSTWTAPLRVGARTYSPLLTTSADETTIQVELPPRKLFGIIPGWHKIGFAPWLVGYLLLVIPLVFVVRWLLRTR